MPSPRPAPAPVPGNPSAVLAQAQPLAEQVAANARVAQQQAQAYRQSAHDEVAVESIDGLVLAAENLVEQIRTQNFEEARFATQQLDAQLQATEAAIEIALQRSNNLANAASAIQQARSSVSQLVQLLGAQASEDTGSTPSAPGSDDGAGGYDPDDRPPYED